MLLTPQGKRILRLTVDIAAQVPSSLDVHIIMDDYATHRTDKGKAWLAHRPNHTFISLQLNVLD